MLDVTKINPQSAVNGNNNKNSRLQFAILRCGQEGQGSASPPGAVESKNCFLKLATYFYSNKSIRNTQTIHMKIYVT